MFTQITRIRTGKLAKPAFVWFLALMQCANMCLQLGMRGGRVTTPITHIGSLACVGALMVILGLVRGKSFVAVFVAACIRPVASMAKQVTGKFGTLLEVFRESFAGIPLTETVYAIVYVGGFDVFVQTLRGIEDGKA